MITLRQRIIKISPREEDFFHDLFRDTHEQFLNFESLRLFPPAFTRKPWAGKVSVDKTQFEIVDISNRLYGRNRSGVIVSGKMIVINNERWLKLTYRLLWYRPVSIVLLGVFLAFFIRWVPTDNFIPLLMVALTPTPFFLLYWDLRETDNRILAYIHESRTKADVAAQSS